MPSVPADLRAEGGQVRHFANQNRLFYFHSSTLIYMMLII